jgi:hypothetical protein
MSRAITPTSTAVFHYWWHNAALEAMTSEQLEATIQAKLRRSGHRVDFSREMVEKSLAFLCEDDSRIPLFDINATVLNDTVMIRGLSYMPLLTLKGEIID